MRILKIVFRDKVQPPSGDPSVLGRLWEMTESDLCRITYADGFYTLTGSRVVRVPASNVAYHEELHPYVSVAPPKVADEFDTDQGVKRGKKRG